MVDRVHRSLGSLSRRNFEFCEATYFHTKVLNEAQECGREDIRITGERIVLEFSTFCLDWVIFWISKDQIDTLKMHFFREIVLRGFYLNFDVEVELRWLEHNRLSNFKGGLGSDHEIVENTAWDLWPVLLWLQERLNFRALILLDFVFVDFLDVKKVRTIQIFVLGTKLMNYQYLLQPFFYTWCQILEMVLLRRGKVKWIDSIAQMILVIEKQSLRIS